MPTFNFRQTKIHFTQTETASKKPVLVCIHGFLENATMWQSIIPQFQDKYRIICIDLPGHGQTEAMGYIHTMPNLAEIIRGLLKHLNLHHAHFVGHSLGGYVLLALAEVAPEVIQQQIILNSTSFSDSSSRKKDRDRAIKMAQKYPKAFTSMAVKNLFLPQMHLRHEDAINEAVEQAKNCPTQGIINTLKGMRDREDRTNTLIHLKTKTHIIAGQDDPIANTNALKQIAQKHNLNFKLLPGGHMSYIEALPELIQHLKRML